jgi:hypothetical protein
MKHSAQARDRALVARGGPVDEQFLIRPELARGAKVVWPNVDLLAKRPALTAGKLFNVTQEFKGKGASSRRKRR